MSQQSSFKPRCKPCHAQKVRIFSAIDSSTAALQVIQTRITQTPDGFGTRRSNPVLTLNTTEKTFPSSVSARTPWKQTRWNGFFHFWHKALRSCIVYTASASLPLLRWEPGELQWRKSESDSSSGITYWARFNTCSPFQASSRSLCLVCFGSATRANLLDGGNAGRRRSINSAAK